MSSTGARILLTTLTILLLWYLALAPSNEDLVQDQQHHLRPDHHQASLRDVQARQLFGTPSADYRRARAKGERMICSFSDPSNAPASKFTAVSDLKDWGWDSTQIPGDDVTRVLKNFAGELKAKGISADSPPVQGMSWRHARSTVHDGKTYPATSGKYDVLYDPRNGMIIPASSYGPAWYLTNKKGASEHLPANTPAPKLNVWSDVAFLTWLQGTTPQNRQSLRYIVNINCINQTSVDIVSEALKRDKVPSGIPPKWPGHTFAQVKAGPFTANDAYAAVLGTPNVLGSGWLILQHQQQLGDKRIGAITVWDSSGFDGGGGVYQLSIMVEVIARK